MRAGRLGGGPVRAAHGLAELAAGAVQARRLLRRLAPQAVIGFGGYPSVPTMLAAASLGLPTLIHEQNAVLGRANRLLAPRVRRIATGFPETIGLRPADRARAVHTGNPVRPAILAVGEPGYRPPLPGGPIELLILGGSQGARILSEIVPPALAALPSGLRAVAQGQPAGAAARISPPSPRPMPRPASPPRSTASSPTCRSGWRGRIWRSAAPAPRPWPSSPRSAGRPC